MTRAVGDVYDDCFTCSTYYSTMVSRGIKFAPVDVAKRFSFERPMSGASITKAFGFHGDKTDETKRLCLTE